MSDRENHDESATKCLFLLIVCSSEGLHFRMSGIKVFGSDSKVKGVLLHAVKTLKGNRGTTLPKLNPGATKGWVVSTTPWPLYPWEKDTLLIVQGAEWALEPGYISHENLAFNGI